MPFFVDWNLLSLYNVMRLFEHIKTNRKHRRMEKWQVRKGNPVHKIHRKEEEAPAAQTALPAAHLPQERIPPAETPLPKAQKDPETL